MANLVELTQAAIDNMHARIVSGDSTAEDLALFTKGLQILENSRDYQASIVGMAQDIAAETATAYAQLETAETNLIASKTLLDNTINFATSTLTNPKEMFTVNNVLSLTNYFDYRYCMSWSSVIDNKLYVAIRKHYADVCKKYLYEIDEHANVTVLQNGSNVTDIGEYAHTYAAYIPLKIEDSIAAICKRQNGQCTLDIFGGTVRTLTSNTTLTTMYYDTTEYKLYYELSGNYYMADKLGEHLIDPIDLPNMGYIEIPISNYSIQNYEFNSNNTSGNNNEMLDAGSIHIQNVLYVDYNGFTGYKKLKTYFISRPFMFGATIYFNAERVFGIIYDENNNNKIEIMSYSNLPTSLNGSDSAPYIVGSARVLGLFSLNGKVISLTFLGGVATNSTSYYGGLISQITI